MTTQHNPTVPHRSNPLQVRVTARILLLRHSQSWSLHWMFPLADVLNLHTSIFFPTLHSTLLCTRSFHFIFPPNRLRWQPFLGMPSSIRCSSFRRLIWSSSQLSWCDTRALRMVLRLVSLGYTPSSLAFWPSLGFETSCRRCSSYTAQSCVPVPSPFVCLMDWECSCAWGSKLRTIFLQDAFDGRGRSLRSGGAYDSRAAHQRGQESDTQFTDRNNVTVYSVL